MPATLSKLNDLSGNIFNASTDAFIIFFPPFITSKIRDYYME